MKEGGFGHRSRIAIRDIRYYSKRRRFVALARALWLVLVLRHYSETCDVCGRRYHDMIWRAPDALYESVVGNLRGLICPRCFSIAARAKNLRLTWTPTSRTRSVMTGEYVGD